MLGKGEEVESRNKGGMEQGKGERNKSKKGKREEEKKKESRNIQGSEGMLLFLFQRGPHMP